MCAGTGASTKWETRCAIWCITGDGCFSVLSVLGESDSGALNPLRFAQVMIGIMKSAIGSCGIGRVVRVRRWLKSECAPAMILNGFDRIKILIVKMMATKEIL